MDAGSIRPWVPPLLIGAGIVAIAGSIASIAAIVDWLPSGAGRTVGTTTAPVAITVDLRRARADCGNCGVVESIRAVEARPASGTGVRLVAANPAPAPSVERGPTSYRITVRMDDGSYRTLSQPVPPTFSPGAQVRVADGAVVALR
jgi:hypothetical protein